MPKTTGSTSVPKGMQATFEAITSLTDAFCREHLNEDYRVLAQRTTAALCRRCPSLPASGQPRTWRAGATPCWARSTFCLAPPRSRS